MSEAKAAAPATTEVKVVKKTDPAKTKLIATLKHTRPLTAARYEPLGRFIFTGAEDNTVQRWDVADLQPAADGKPVVTAKMASLVGHDSWIRSIAFSKNGETTFTGGYDGQLFAWRTADEQPAPVVKLAAHEGWIRAVVVSPDGKLLATCGNDRLVKLWRVDDFAAGKTPQPVKVLTGHDCHVYNVAFHPDNKHFVSCDLKANCKHWELDSGKLVREFAATDLYKYDTTFRADIGGARALTFSLDGTQLAAGGITKVTNAFAGIGVPAVAVIVWGTGKPQVQYTSKDAANATIWGLEPHVDGYWIGVAGSRQANGGGLYFWRGADVNEFFKFKVTATGRDLAVHPQGHRLAIPQANQDLCIFDIAG